MKKPGFIIAGTNSGCGKTTVTAGILAALAERGLAIQPFKVGPDFIDPMFHTFIAGRASRNLDSWMLGADTVRYLYARNCEGADIAVVEGVMGFFDGYGSLNEGGSTAHVAKLTGLPVILVVNSDGMALSTAALVKGFMEFDREVMVKGVIFNNVYGEDHYRLLKGFVEENTGARALGYLKRKEQYELGSRHLGLVTAGEIQGLKDKVNELCGQVKETIDLDGIISIAAGAAPVSASNPMEKDGCRISRTACAARKGNVRIAVASDKAFCFYYKDNLELLETLGAELSYFSPVSDARLPEGADGLYMGGGYPEVWAGELEANASMRLDIKRKVGEGLPAYAECGGLMYMCEAIRDKNGRPNEMVGLIPGASRMTGSLKRFGYVEIDITEDNILAIKGQKIRGHEFHFSDVDIDRKTDTCYRVSQKRTDGGRLEWGCGYKHKNLLAGYAHLHFYSNPLFAVQFIENCRLL